MEWHHVGVRSSLGGRRVFSLIVLVSLLSIFAQPAPSFAAIQNDDRESATTISSIPLWDSVDTNNATTSAEEQSICDISNGVWYKYPAPPVDTQLTYILGNVVEGEGNLTSPMVAFILEDGSSQCGGASMDQNIWSVVPAGMDAYILIGNGFQGHPGLVQLGVFMAEPVNHFSVAINGNASVTGGSLTASGTVACERSDAVYFVVRVQQKSGHGFITGETPLQAVQCDAPASPWSMSVAPAAGGRFVAGKATVSAEVICPVPAACSGARSEASVKVNVRN
jgi:hypothetical protein